MTLKILSRTCAIALATTLAACGGGGGGGGGSSSSSQENDSSSNAHLTAGSSTGYFIDSAVAGMSYTTTNPNDITFTGNTGANGEYQYFPGRSITFQLGDFVLGAATGSSLTTPYSFMSEDTHEDYPQNLAQLLLSLDSNQDASDGIQISEAVRAGFENLTAGQLDMIDQPADVFDSDFQSFVTSALPEYSANIVTAAEAESHLNESMASIDYEISLPGSQWRTELQPQFLQVWSAEDERWTSYQTCSNGDYNLYIVDDYSEGGVQTTSWDSFAWTPSCTRDGEEVTQALRDLDEQTLCGYKLYANAEADISTCTFADLNTKVTYTTNDNVMVTLHTSHEQGSNVVRQTIYEEYTQGEQNNLFRAKWHLVITRSTTD